MQIENEKYGPELVKLYGAERREQEKRLERLTEGGELHDALQWLDMSGKIKCLSFVLADLLSNLDEDLSYETTEEVDTMVERVLRRVREKAEAAKAAKTRRPSLSKGRAFLH